MARSRRILATGVVVLLLIAIGYYAKPSVFSSADSSADMPVKLAACADITQGCTVDGTTVVFDRQPRVMQPFHLKLQTPAAKAVHMSFSMDGMQMGLNRYRLIEASSGHWVAEVTLPVCVQSRSDWMLEVTINRADRTLHYQIPFATYGRAHSPAPEPAH